MSGNENGSTSSQRVALTELASDFLNEILLRTSWFAGLNAPLPLWDVLFIGGSLKYNIARPDSDVDLFLVMPRHIQLERQINPVYEFRFRHHIQVVCVCISADEKQVSHE